MTEPATTNCLPSVNLELDSWIVEAQHGGESFSKIYQHFLPKIYNYVYYRIGHTEKTEDLVAEVFLAVAKHFKTFSGNSTYLSAWIYTIARNHINNFYRQKKRKTQIFFEPDEVMNIVAVDSEAFAKVEKNLQIHKIREAMQLLTEIDQEIIALQYFEGMDRHQIASIVGFSPGAVATRASRALKKLKGLLQQQAA
ncbi:MAG: sigma-70 family RNA polymerase sigma factor [bacterium]